MEDEFTLSWEDGSEWEISWFRDAGCYFAQRWLPEPDDGADGPFVETPGPDEVMVEDLETLEAVMGRPLPQVSPASSMGPPDGEFRQQHGTTSSPVMGPPRSIHHHRRR